MRHLCTVTVQPPGRPGYGAPGGVIIFLVWLWLFNVAVLLGAEFNAELERGRQIDAGHPPEKEPFLEPRDTRKNELSRIPSAYPCPPTLASSEA